jgi:hypothetical protein
MLGWYIEPILHYVFRMQPSSSCWYQNVYLTRSQENVDLYIHTPIHIHGVVLNELSTETTLPLIRQSAEIPAQSLMKCCGCCQSQDLLHGPRRLLLAKPPATEEYGVVLLVISRLACNFSTSLVFLSTFSISKCLQNCWVGTR